jgi:hypothetical protein
MKTGHLPFLISIFALFLWSCNDKCKETRITRNLVQVTRSLKELRAQVASEEAHSLVHPGKMYIKGKYLFINEIKEGIHVIDNGDPSNPRLVSFIKIPGNGDLAVRDNILYADSYSDLVALDIQDPLSVKEVGRVENVFLNGQFDGVWWSVNSTTNAIRDAAITDYNVEYVTQTVTTNCEENNVYPIYNFLASGLAFADASFSKGAASSASPNSAGTSGTGGSMARFALYSNYLYTVGQNDLHLFNISAPAKPKDFATINIGWGIETIFPYKDKLFIGSNTGMFIYDNSNPATPKQLSVFQHGRACDPVVVDENTAYVTIRTGTACNGTQNQLDIVDIKDPASPQLLKSYQMENPHGLSIDSPTLYLCEGDHGLKVFNAEDKMAIDKNQLAYFKDMHAYDVISLGKTLLVIGKDGFYQYDSTDPKNLKLLSKILVQTI